MKIARFEVRLKKKATLPGWQAAIISFVAVFFALALFSLIFLADGINPLEAYRFIFRYAFVSPYGLGLTINRSVFLLLCTCAFIIPLRAGLWNIGMTGQLYAGTMGAFAVLLAFGGKESLSADLPAGITNLCMLLAAAAAGALLAAIAGFLKGKLDTNEIVVTMMLNFAVSWLVAHMIKEGGPFMNPGGRGESFEIPPSAYAPVFRGVPFTILLALGAAVVLHVMFARTRLGYQIKAYGHSPAAARYSGISTVMVPLLVFVMGGALAGLAGYHYFAAVPGVYKIARNYATLGDLAFYGIICGLISLGDSLAAIPVAVLFGALSIGGRYVQGQLSMGFGLDYALLGVLMITLVAFQFFYRYSPVLVRPSETSEKAPCGNSSPEV
jgi:ABC-type uncharacterized transport system permease subunit